MALIVATWCWGEKYGDHYVKRLAAGIHRNLTEAHRFICFTDRERHLPEIGQAAIPMADRALLGKPGCFARLRIFDPAYQRDHGIEPGDRVVNMDLDLVVTGELDPLFNRPEPFVIFGGANAANPCPYNGSLWMLRAGYRPDVWSAFSIEAASKIRKHEFADDQGWFWDRIPDAATWQAGVSSGAYGMQKPGWPPGTTDLPKGARCVAFFGKRDPAQFEHLDWVRAHWR